MGSRGRKAMAAALRKAAQPEDADKPTVPPDVRNLQDFDPLRRVFNCIGKRSNHLLQHDKAQPLDGLTLACGLPTLE